VSRDNPKYIALPLEGRKIHQIVFSSTGRINISLTDLEGFLVWQKEPDDLKTFGVFLSD